MSSKLYISNLHEINNILSETSDIISKHYYKDSLETWHYPDNKSLKKIKESLQVLKYKINMVDFEDGDETVDMDLS